MSHEENVWEQPSAEATNNPTEEKDDLILPTYGSYDTSTRIDSEPVNVGNLQVRSMESTGLCIELKSLEEIILNETVPVSLSAVAVLGLPYCGKSHILQKLFASQIRLKQRPEKVEKHMKLFEQDNGLSMYTLCVLGGQTHSKYAWSFTSRRYGVTYTVISSIIRKFGILNLRNIRLCEEACDQVFKHEILNEHHQWIFNRVRVLLQSIQDDHEEDKIDLLANGFSLVNVFDAGVSKAVYDFLPYLTNCCGNLIRLVFFSMERDSRLLSDPPTLNYDKYRERHDDSLVMHWRPRLSYLMHFASLGFQPGLPETEGNTVFIGTWNEDNAVAQPYSKDFIEAKKSIYGEAVKGNLRWISESKYWLEVYINQHGSLKLGSSSIEQVIMQNSTFNCYLPVKWMFLRSFLSSRSSLSSGTPPIIVHTKTVNQLASVLGMDEEEVNEFLLKFVNYGSLLYFPDFVKLKQFVIVDTYKFTELLGTLYYPEPSKNWLHHQYGILSENVLAKLVRPYVQTEIFMTIVTELGMAATVTRNCKVKLLEDNSVLDQRTYYFVPSARTGGLKEPAVHHANVHSVYLCVMSVQFPANIQSSIAHAMINENHMYLTACKFSNVTMFESSNGLIKVEITYFGQKTELKLTKCDTNRDEAVVALCGVLRACCVALTERKQQIRDLMFSICMKCQHSSNDFHEIFYELKPDLCESCEKTHQTSEYLQLWVEAARKCEHLVADSAARLKKETPLSAEDCMHIAGALENESENRIEKFARALNIDEDTLKNLKSEQGGKLKDWHLIVKLIFEWEKQTRKLPNEIPSKQHLAKVLKDIGLQKLSNKINYRLSACKLQNFND